MFGWISEKAQNSPWSEAEKDKRQCLLAYHSIEEPQLSQTDRDDKCREGKSGQKKGPIGFQSFPLKLKLCFKIFFVQLSSRSVSYFGITGSSGDQFDNDDGIARQNSDGREQSKKTIVDLSKCQLN